MGAYYDTSALLKLLISEPESPAVMALVQGRAVAIQFNALQEFEAKNALGAKLYRKEISNAELLASVGEIGENVRRRRFQSIDLELKKVMAEAERLSSRITPTTGCRAIDLLHVAIARLFNCDAFVSMDVRQLKAARMAGLTVIDPRKSS